MIAYCFRGGGGGDEGGLLTQCGKGEGLEHRRKDFDEFSQLRLRVLVVRTRELRQLQFSQLGVYLFEYHCKIKL